MFASEVSDAVQAATVLCPLVDRSFEKDVKFGDTIRIPDASNPAVRYKSDDTSATWANIVETSQTITINRHAYSAMLFEGIMELQANIPVEETYTGKMGYSLTHMIEGDATSGMVSLGNSFSQVAGTLGQDPTEDDIIDAVRQLNAANTPETGRFGWFSPGGYAALLKLDRFTRADFVGQKQAETAIEQAKIGVLYGAPIYQSSLADANPSAANQAYCWYGHRRSVALIVQQEPTLHSDWVILEESNGVYVSVVYQFVERLITPVTLGGTTPTDALMVAIRSR